MQDVYRTILVEQLAKSGVHFKHVEIVDDAAGNGAKALAVNA